MVTLKNLLAALNNELKPECFQDYCPNGLQVQGSENVRLLVSGVTASEALIDQAIALKADALLVHHGFFWKGEDPCVLGMKHRRLKKLLAHDISLLAYHLPLDAHPRLGNNAQLAMRLGIAIDGPMDANSQYPIGNVGHLLKPMMAGEFAEQVANSLSREPLLIGDERRVIHSIAWCTGAAQGYIDKAAALGVDLYLSGEISEPTVHVARELGVHYLAAGHHATERYGVKALAEEMAQRFGLSHHFVDSDNPV